jgi:hypothetical protein
MRVGQPVFFFATHDEKSTTDKNIIDNNFETFNFVIILILYMSKGS